MSQPATIIVSALVRRDERLLLVEQQGPWDPAPSWMLPGGRVEAGESLLGALGRELAEETCLRLIGAPRIAFAVEVTGRDGIYSALTFACEADGAILPQDPDGFVRQADWVPIDEALDRLGRVDWHDCLPIADYLSGDASIGAVYTFDRR